MIEVNENTIEINGLDETADAIKPEVEGINFFQKAWIGTKDFARKHRKALFVAGLGAVGGIAVGIKIMLMNNDVIDFEIENGETIEVDLNA